MELVSENKGMTIFEIRSHMGMPEIEIKKTAVYKHKNEKGEVIYVGVATSAAQRSIQHLNASEWKEQIVTIDVEWMPNRLAAEVKEIELIKELRPKYNKTYNDGLHVDLAVARKLQTFFDTAKKKNTEELSNYYATIENINWHNTQIKKFEKWKRKTKKEKEQLENFKKDLIELNEELQVMEDDDEIDALLMEQILMTESPNQWITMQLIAGSED